MRFHCHFFFNRVAGLHSVETIFTAERLCRCSVIPMSRFLNGRRFAKYWLCWKSQHPHLGGSIGTGILIFFFFFFLPSKISYEKQNIHIKYTQYSLLCPVISTSLLVLKNTLAALKHRIIKNLHNKKPFLTVSKNVSIEAHNDISFCF